MKEKVKNVFLGFTKEFIVVLTFVVAFRTATAKKVALEPESNYNLIESLKANEEILDRLLNPEILFLVIIAVSIVVLSRLAITTVDESIIRKTIAWAKDKTQGGLRHWLERLSKFVIRFSDVVYGLVAGLTGLVVYSIIDPAREPGWQSTMDLISTIYTNLSGDPGQGIALDLIIISVLIWLLSTIFKSPSVASYENVLEKEMKKS